MQGANLQPDLEKGQAPRRDGYPSLAVWIAHDPDNESYVFRKFDALGARNLLNLQAQLFELEKKLKDMDDEAWNGNDVELKSSLRRWETFEEHSKEAGRPEVEKMQLEMELKEKVKEYHEALLLQSQICRLQKPEARVLRAFRAFFRNPADPQDIIIRGKARFMLDDTSDVVALHTLPTDPLSSLLRRYWPAKRYASSKSERTQHFQDLHVRVAVGVINALMAAFLMLGAIVSLYYVTKPAAKLGIIGGFTVLFAATVASFTRARRVEVFAASAAYAAVLVVFVSGNLKDA